MEAVKEFLRNIESYIVPIWGKVDEFLSTEMYIVYAAIAVLVALLVLVGLVTALKKFPRFFIFIVVVLAALGAGSFFLIYR